MNQFRLYLFSAPRQFVVISDEPEAVVRAKYKDFDTVLETVLHIDGDAFEFPCDRKLFDPGYTD